MTAGRALLVAVASLAVAGVQAADAKKVDVELLEFLGSIDAEEQGLQEYLEQKPVKPVEKPRQKPARAAVQPVPAPVKKK